MSASRKTERKGRMLVGPRARAASAYAFAVGRRVFDARPDRSDVRDLPYRPPLRSLPPCFPKCADMPRLFPRFVGHGLILDQGSEGACTSLPLFHGTRCRPAD